MRQLSFPVKYEYFPKKKIYLFVLVHILFLEVHFCYIVYICILVKKTQSYNCKPLFQSPSLKKPSTPQPQPQMTLVRSLFFSKTARTIFLIFCTKLDIFKSSKVTESDFWKKNLLPGLWPKKGSKWPKFESLQFFSESNLTIFLVF